MLFFSPLGSARNLGGSGTFSSVESALSPMKLDPIRGPLNIHADASVFSDILAGDIFGPLEQQPRGDGVTTDNTEKAPGIDPFTKDFLGAGLVVALIIGALVWAK